MPIMLFLYIYRKLQGYIIIVPKDNRLLSTFRLFISMINRFLRVRLVYPTYCMLQFIVFQVKTYMRSVDFQFSSELLITENVLPLTDEVMAELVHK